MKRSGTRKTSGKQYTYYCCERQTSADENNRCDFMTWDVPVKDDCPVCGQTMFKKSGRGFKKPFCINPACANFLPEDKRGYPKKPAAAEESANKAAETASAAEEKPAEKKTAAKKTTAKKTTAKKTTAAKKTTKTAAKKTTTRKTAAKKTATKTEETEE